MHAYNGLDKVWDLQTEQNTVRKNEAYLIFGKLIRTLVIRVAINPPQGKQRMSWLRQSHVLKGNLKLHIIFNVKREILF